MHRLLIPALVGLFLSAGHALSARDYIGPDGPEFGESLPEGVLIEEIPAPLRPWIPWVKPDLEPPAAYDDETSRMPVWAARLQIAADETGATFTLGATAFESAWLVLPGGAGIWPREVSIGDSVVPVVEREGRPAIQLPAGESIVTGTFDWPVLPQQIKLPPVIGILELTVNGAVQPNPSWDADGTLWMQREASSEPVDEDFLSTKVHSLLADGIPLWFETRIDLIVAGKSREETLGSVLPEGWKLAEIEAPIPVAIDDRGLLKAQLRAGRWSIMLRAFQNRDASEISFAAGVTPAVSDQSISYRGQSDFRQAEITGLPQIDVAQTQVPEEWRSLPVYRWDTATPFSLVERVRGAGDRGAAPLTIRRSLWLDDDGGMLTYQDTLTGPLEKIRRLDAAEGHLLGSVSVGGEPQLITHNPVGGAPGFEVRAPQLSAVATGRIKMDETLPATGWQADADGLSATMQLPPGYRLLALFGADYSRGDWLTSWTLLDLFLLFLFTLAVFRIRGFAAAILAFVAFGLAYHEPGAPRYPWLFLLVPVALVTFMPGGKWRKLAVKFKWACAVLLLLFLVPFVAFQIQGAIFPQMERKSAFSMPTGPVDFLSGSVKSSAMLRNYEPEASEKSVFVKKKQNLRADPKAVIQTGPGVPSWSWRSVEFGWQGPVSRTQTVQPVLIPPALSRLLAVARALSLFALAGVLLTSRRKKRVKDDAPRDPSAKPVAALLIGGLALLSMQEDAAAQFPQSALLDELKERLTDSSDAFPGAAEIPSADLMIDARDFTFVFEYHAAARAAAPVPVPLAVAIPDRAVFADGTDATLLRKDGQLWVLLPGKGIHEFTVTGRLRNVTDWEWGFTLKPRRFSVEAEGWNVSGIRPNGSAEDQILFSRTRDETGSSSASYGRPDTNHALLIERKIELGLVWRVETTVSRLSPTGRAVVTRVPILPGEKVVSAGRSVKDGAIEVRLAPDAERITWEGELSPVESLTLKTRESDDWTEQWKLVASSVWNVTFEGLEPSYVVNEEQLMPLWQPWPGETATITVSRPEAVAGAAVTIDSAEHALEQGRRQRSSTLTLSLRTSLGEDFAIGLPPGAEVTTLTHLGKPIPIRKEGDAVVVPLRPGAQKIKVEWRLPSGDDGWTRVDPVQLPVEVANLKTVIRPTEDRWLVLTDGPLRGPAVRFWGVLAFVLLVAFVLSRISGNPLRAYEWFLLALGLTQIPIVLGLVVVLWLFAIRWRGSDDFQTNAPWHYNAFQVILIFLTICSLGIFIGIASAGLLGDPEMYVAGNGSTDRYLAWFSARAAAELPEPGYWSISIWWYRLAMLVWALWLASALVRWLRLAWKNSTRGGHFKAEPKKVTAPPEIPE